VIDAGARGALAKTRTRRLGVIGTEATIASRAYVDRLQGIDPGARVFAASCPLFVPLAEEGWTDRDVTREIARVYLGPILAERIDTLILGCTHYPLLRGVISEVAGADVTLVDSAEETAREVVRVLEREHLLAPAGAEGGAVYYVSDSPERFLREAVRFLGRPVGSVTRVEQSDVPWYERVPVAEPPK
jgi:glutamate racemase